MANKPEKKTSAPDYFKLPFEVYYSEHVGVTMLEFKSNIPVKKFEDIKIVHREQGDSRGLSFYCGKNTGSELYCCINNLHDEVVPEWLTFLDEDDMEMNSGDNFVVEVEDDEITFRDLNDEEWDEGSKKYLDIKSMEACCSWTFLTYDIGDSSPDYLILDADDSRIKVDLNGFILDENDEATETRIFNPEELKEEDFDNYTRSDLWQAKADWVKSVLEKDFPKQTKLKLSFDTE